MTAPCPRCGEPRGGRYRAPGGELVCWPCLGIEPVQPGPPVRKPWQDFRQHILDRLKRVDPDGFWPYIDRDHCAGTCPVCRSARPHFLAVSFHGAAARADLVCTRGCPQEEIAAAFGLDWKP